jgi:carbonic anhydrase/acetyltransferase-like protein (isoleucine patch superfamily)
VVGHIAHLEGATVEDDVLIGSGSVVLHRAHIHSGSIVAAGAVVRDDTIVPPRSLALGVPAIIKEGVVDPNLFRWNVDMYIQNALNYKSKLRRIN